MKKITTYITEKFRITKNFKIDTSINDTIDAEKSHLFRNISLDSVKLPISYIYWTIGSSSLTDIVELDPKYAKQCLEDHNLYDKDCSAMYIPQIDYTYIKKIDTDMLEKYDGRPFVTDKENYDIYYKKTSKYFLLRIVTLKTHITLDFIIVL